MGTWACCCKGMAGWYTASRTVFSVKMWKSLEFPAPDSVLPVWLRCACSLRDVWVPDPAGSFSHMTGEHNGDQS